MIDVVTAASEAGSRSPRARTPEFTTAAAEGQPVVPSAAHLAETLRLTEKLSPDATGALVAGDPRKPRAAILVERGRICWVVAGARRQRLTDLLMSRCEPPLERLEIERIFLRCQQSGAPVGETLVAQGRISSGALRDSLKRYSAESLLTGQVWQTHLSWIAHRSCGYQPRFTFLPAELFAEAGALLCGDQRVRQAAGALQPCGAVPAGAFLHRGKTLLASVGEALPLSEWLTAGEWCTRALARVSGSVGQVRFALASSGAIWVTWRSQGLSCVARCGSRAAFSQVIGKLNLHGFSAAAQSAETFGCNREEALVPST